MKASKLLKYPKKPKMSASLTVKSNFLARCKDIDKENDRRIKEYHHLKKEEAKINGLISSHTMHPKPHRTTVIQKYSRKKR